MKVFEIIVEDANTFKKGAEDANKLAKHATAMHSKIDARLANTPGVNKTQQYKDYKKTSQQKKIDAMKKGMPYGRQDVGETSGGKGEAMLAKADMLLQGTGFARKGFEIVKAAQQGMVRGSITDQALAMVKNLIAKAQAMGATDAPDPAPIQQPAQIDDKEFEGMYETFSGDIGSIATPVAPMQRRNMYNADGTMKNGADFGNLLGGKKKSTKTKKK